MLAFYPVGRGDAYDDYAISIARSANTFANSSVDGQPATPTEAIYVVDIWLTQSDGDDVIVESYDVSFDEEAVDDVGDSLYIEDVINRFSTNIKVAVNETSLNEWKRLGTLEIEVGTSVTPIHFFHGSEGSVVSVDADTGKRTIDITEAKLALSDGYLGLAVNPVTSEFEDRVLDLDEYYFPLVWDAGYPTDVKNSIVTLTSDIRLDGVAILDNGDNISYAEAITSRTTDHNFNTRYASLFEPYSKLFDIHTGKDVWFSPVFHMASMIPLNDKLYEIWYPSAGFNRGTIDSIKELRFSPKLAQRDQFYLKQINPIVRFSIGETVWGNLTTQKRPSALQDLSIMRMVLYIKRALEQFLKWFIFDFNDPAAWNEMQNSITPFLQSIQEARGLESFTVDIGATEYEKKRKVAHVNVTLVPNRIIERIELNFFIR